MGILLGYPTPQDGKSAYEIAVDNGFVGTEAQWLLSLVGPQGPQGIAGPPGTGLPGAQGVGIQSTSVDSNGDLQIVYTNGNTQNAGHVVGSPGPAGPPGSSSGSGGSGTPVAWNWGFGTSGFVSLGGSGYYLKNGNLVTCTGWVRGTGKIKLPFPAATTVYVNVEMTSSTVKLYIPAGSTDSQTSGIFATGTIGSYFSFSYSV